MRMTWLRWAWPFAGAACVPGVLSTLGAGCSETASNNAFVRAMPVALDNDGAATVAGTITGDLDPDFYSIGPLDAGDRIIVDVDTPESDLDAAVAVIDAYRNMVAVSDDEDAASGNLDPLVDVTLRRPASDHVVAINRSDAKAPTAGAYQMRINVLKGGAPAARTQQTVVLDFGGGAITAPDGTIVSVPPFDAAGIDALYAGQTQNLKDAIVDTFKANFAPYELRILTSDDEPASDDESVSVILFGGASADFDVVTPETYGWTPGGTDAYNADPTDDAVVFTGSFTPDLFSSPPSVDDLGLVIGNVAAHEMGHLLGLNHAAFDGLMRFINPAAFLDELAFDRNLVDDRVFLTIPADVAWQDDEQLLRDVLGEYPDPIGLVTADVDADGTLDVVTANQQSDNVTVLIGGGDGTFDVAGSFFVGPTPADIATADFDADGHPDVVVAHFALPTARDAATGFSILLNEGNGRLSLPISLAAEIEPAAVAVGDFDGDGHIDIVACAATLDDQTAVFFNGGDATFTQPVLIDPLPDTRFVLECALDVADYDGDDDLDIAMADCEFDAQRITLIRNNGDRTFAAEPLPTGNAPCTLDSADTNGDGLADVVVGRDSSGAQQGGIDVLVSDGAAGFGVASIEGIASTITALAVGDLDGDGDVDVAAALGFVDPPMVAVLLNDGFPQFARTDYVAGSDVQGLDIADVTGDGAPDLIMVDSLQDAVLILVNDATGRFPTQRVVEFGPT